MSTLKYGEGSDTWSANPLACAAVLATLDEYEGSDVLAQTAKLNTIFVDRLMRLKEIGIISKVRAEGMVLGIECAEVGGHASNDIAIKVVEKCCLGRDGVEIHLLGALEAMSSASARS